MLEEVDDQPMFDVSTGYTVKEWVSLTVAEIEAAILAVYPIPDHISHVSKSCGVIGPGIDVWSLSRSLASSKRRLMQHTLGRRKDIEMKTTSGCETNDNDGGDD